MNEMARRPPVSTTFSHSLRSLAADGFQPSLWSLFLAAASLVAVAAWLFLARVTIYEVTPAAQVETRASEKLKIVAYFPLTAWGRIQPGQPARLRVNGYPWTQAGSIAAVVSNIAQETKSEQLRVELAILPDLESPMPLRPGLAGTAEVEVERVSPATLVLRAIGPRLTPRASQP